MIITLNGKLFETSENTTLLELVESLGIIPTHVVVEYNTEVPPRSKWKNIIITENSDIEILKFMGGG